jgi:RNA polymerase sigma factor for flagellar operon FliA
MPRAAVLTPRVTKSTSSTTSSRRPVLKVVPARRTTAVATPAAPKSAPKATTNKKTLAVAAPATAATGTPVTYNKNDLLKRFAPLVRHVVERVAATLPRNVDHEDLYSAGVLGLLDAHAKFDTGKGVKFETYAVWRIKGAVLDQLRALDWASRSMRRKARNLDGVTRKLDQKLGRAASEEEVARELKMSREDFYRLLDHVRGAVLVSLDETRTSDGEEQGSLADHLADPNALDLEARLEDDQQRQTLLHTIDMLPEQERLVVALYYYEHLTLKEIGRTLGISESRVSQVHTRAMSRLRLRLQKAISMQEEAA